MADFDKNPQDEFQNQDAEYEMEDGVEYEYVEEEEEGVEYEYVEEEEVAEDGVEYEYVDGEEYETEEVTEEYAEEDGVEYEYVEGEEYATDEDLPDGMMSETGESGEETASEMASDAEGSEYGEGEESEEEGDGENADKPKSFFAKLTEATPYEVMIALAFIILVIGILLMLFQWMGYDMIVYPKYPA